MVEGYLFSLNLWYISAIVPISLEKDLLLFSSALEFKQKKNIMINLIIDAANDKIFFKIMAENKSYTSEYINNRENFDKLVILIFKFLNENKLNVKDIDNIFVNQGPGKFSGIRASLATVKGLSFTNKINVYGFNSNYIDDKNYDKIIELFKDGSLTKNLIKPQY